MEEIEETDGKEICRAERMGERYRYVKSISVKVAIGEDFYKLRYSWYLMPMCLHRILPTVDFKCWRYNEEESSLVHVWWACAKIQIYWRKRYKEINLKLGILL